MVFIAGFWFVGAIVIEATIDGYKKKLQTVQFTQDTAYIVTYTVQNIFEPAWY